MIPQAAHIQNSPAKLGYRLPAEWEPHEATWISWPNSDGISFPGSYDRVIPTFVRMVEALAESEPVHVNVRDADQEKTVRKLLGKSHQHPIRFFHIPTNEPWCRDHGPTFLVRKNPGERAAVNWKFNAWGWKYTPFTQDDEASEKMAAELDIPVFSPEMVLEGGAIDCNGEGTLLTTRSCLLNPNRNPDLTQQEIEQRLTDYLGVTKILWLGDGIEGDDTDGHIDDIARFVAPDLVLVCIEEDPEDRNYEPLLENKARLLEMKTSTGQPVDVIDLPMPSPIMRQGQRLPASYANFYIANSVVLMPAFSDTKDQWAATILQKAFPERKIVPIDSRELIWGLGAFHCLTQQLPSALKP